MQRWKVLVADDNVEFLDMLCERINQEADFEVVASAPDGIQALQAADTYQPDIIILDLVMPQMDGLAVLEQLAKSDQKRHVIVFSALGSDSITQRALALGANAYFLKPFNIEVFLIRMRRLMGVTREQMGERERLQEGERQERQITEILHKLAFAPHLRGYQYLKYAIQCVMQDRGMVERITYLIYPAVAQAFDTTPSRVERSIRNAIETAWDRCRVETMVEFFGYSVDENKGKPSNSEFIAMAADKLTLDSLKGI